MLFRNILFSQIVGADGFGYVPTEAYRSGQLFVGINASYESASQLAAHSKNGEVEKAHANIYVVDASTGKLVAHRDNGLMLSYRNISHIQWLLDDGTEAGPSQVLGKDFGFKEHIWVCTVEKVGDNFLWTKTDEEVFVCRSQHTERLTGMQLVWDDVMKMPQYVQVVSEANKVVVKEAA